MAFHRLRLSVTGIQFKPLCFVAHPLQYHPPLLTALSSCVQMTLTLLIIAISTSAQIKPLLMQTQLRFSILCLTTDPNHQGHEKSKAIRDVNTFTAQTRPRSYAIVKV